MRRAPVVTFDVFSALLDSRRGAAACLGDLAGRRGWPVDGRSVYDAWDRHNKAAHRAARRGGFRSYAELAEEALAAAYAELGLAGDPAADPAADTALLLAGLPSWPTWPDVPEGLAAVAARHRVGLLSNIDDALLERTAVAGPPVDPDLVVTSQRAGAYKPDPRIYRYAARVARDVAGAELVHVASSARDVRGALEAGLRVVRLRRPGHHLDPAGPRPPVEVDDLTALTAVLADLPDG